MALAAQANDGDYANADDAIEALFHKFDRDGSGTVDSRELRIMAACLVGISMRRQYREALRAAELIMERVEEGVNLSLGDFRAYAQSIFAKMPAEEILVFVSKVLEEGESRVMSDDRAAMIEQTCVPVMREALMDMFRGVERFHMDTVAGTNLEDGYLPRHFKHFNPLKHLGKWLNARSRVKLVSGLTQNVALSKLSMREVHMSGLASEQSSDAGGGASLPALFDALSNTGQRNGKAPLDAVITLVKLGFPAASDANIAEELGLKLDPSGRFAPDQWIDATSFMRLVHVAQNRLTREQAEKGVADMTEHLERMVAQSTPESGGDGEEL